MSILKVSLAKVVLDLVNSKGISLDAAVRAQKGIEDMIDDEAFEKIQESSSGVSEKNSDCDCDCVEEC